MTNPDLPTISDPDDPEQLLAMRAAIDARLEQMRGALKVRAQRLGLAVSDDKEKKRRGRPPKDQHVVREE